MAGLLSKFRIDYSDLILIGDVNKKPQPSTVAFFDNLIAGFRQDFSDEEDKTGRRFILYFLPGNVHMMY